MAKWVMDIIYSGGYLGIVFLMFVENVFPPIPSELIIPLAGFMVSKGQFTFAGVVIAGTIGSILGSLPLYYLGRAFGEERLKALADEYGFWMTVSSKDIEKAKKWFDKYGIWAVLFCRLLPGARSLISIPAGLNRMSLVPFLLSSVVGMALWTTVLAALGKTLGENFREVENYFNPISYVILGIIIALYVYRLVTHKRQVKEKENSK